MVLNRAFAQHLHGLGIDVDGCTTKNIQALLSLFPGECEKFPLFSLDYGRFLNRIYLDSQDAIPST